MAEGLILPLAAIVVLGVAAQWVAWRTNVAPLLFFLAIGFLAGPVTGILHPDEMFGDVLAPIISLGVAVILFEGGLSLRIKEVRATGPVVARLVTTSVLITWLAAAAAAHFFLDLSTAVALLLGAILVVSGPTVVGPLLRHVRPRGPSAAVLKWEGIVIDPVGALLAILVFDAVILGDPGQAALSSLASVGRALFVGGLLGVAGAVFLGLALYRHWVPDGLQSAFALMVVLAVFVASDAGQPESGLLAVTLMGVVLANQPYADLEKIIEFKETLRVLIIPSLFILLTARLTLDDLAVVGVPAVLFVLFLVLIVRPATVALAARGSGLTWRDRAFVAGMMPRGIVAAAISAVFALRLEKAGVPDAGLIVSYTFFVIVATGIIYSITSRPLGNLLGIAAGKGGDVLIVGANDVARAMAKTLRQTGLGVQLIDTNATNVTAANVAELPARQANALSDRIEDDVPLERVASVLVMTPNDEVNMLAAIHMADYVDRARTYQLAPHSAAVPEGAPARSLSGRRLFGKDWDFTRLRQALASGYSVRATKITEEFSFDDYVARYEARHTPLFVVSAGELRPFTSDLRPEVLPGMQIVALVKDE